MNTPICDTIREWIKKCDLQIRECEKDIEKNNAALKKLFIFWGAESIRDDNRAIYSVIHNTVVEKTLLENLLKKIEPMENWYLNSIKIQSELLEKYMPKSKLSNQ